MQGAYNWTENLNSTFEGYGYYKSKANPQIHLKVFENKFTLTSTWCHKSPARTKDSTVGGVGRTRAILRRTRRRVLKIEKGDKIR